MPALGAPEDVEAYCFDIGLDEYVLLTFPVPNEEDGKETHDCLTPAERAVVAMVLEGQSNAGIARARRTSPRTIANQLAAIYRKLGVSSRRQLGARQRSRTGRAR